MEVYKIINDEFDTNYSDNNQIEWEKLLSEREISENIIDSCAEYIPWDTLLKYQKLSEELIERHLDKIDWFVAFEYQYFSEEFIERHLDKAKWCKICQYQKLSENFIEKHSDKIDWFEVSYSQKLSEDFIFNNLNKLEIRGILRYQHLSETALQKIVDGNLLKIYSSDMQLLCKYNQLSEDFINRNRKKVVWFTISDYQKLSDNFIKNHKDVLWEDFINDNWLYKSTEDKKQAVINTGNYECHDDYFIAYKAIRNDRYSLFNFQYKYEKGGIYESWCDCSNNEDSFGLNVGTEEFANDYASCILNNFKIVRCKVRYEDVGRIVHDGEKVRCLKIEILD